MVARLVLGRAAVVLWLDGFRHPPWKGGFGGIFTSSEDPA